jgi:hypothetical protein
MLVRPDGQARTQVARRDQQQALAQGPEKLGS